MKGEVKARGKQERPEEETAMGKAKTQEVRRAAGEERKEEKAEATATAKAGRTGHRPRRTESNLPHRR